LYCTIIRNILCIIFSNECSIEPWFIWTWTFANKHETDYSYIGVMSYIPYHFYLSDYIIAEISDNICFTVEATVAVLKV